jgi:hypothetical protein
MDLLTQDFATITFEDVMEFCDQHIVESTILEYKREITRDLAKHIAAMSNRLGGLIIVGVEEGSRTGTPSKYEGIQNDGKLIERVHQHANNVRPLPTYNVRTTNEIAGKVFLLVKIDEGGAPPYTPTNDPTVYLRTGNITTPLGPADTRIVRDLYTKRSSAERARQDNINRGNSALLSAVKQEVANGTSPPQVLQSAKGSAPPLSTEGLLAASPLLTVYLQPFYPVRELALPREILYTIGNISIEHPVKRRHFPTEPRMRPVARGMLSLSTLGEGPQFICDQIYSNGFFTHTEYAGSFRAKGSVGQIFMQDIASMLYMALLFGRNLYKHLGYSGVTEGAIELKGAQGRQVHLLPPYESGFIEQRVIDQAYSWQVTANTHQLSDDTWLHDYFYKVMREIHWDLGVVDVRRDEFDGFTTEYYSG